MIFKHATAEIIALALVVLTFYRHGTPQNFWYRLGRWSRKII